MITFDEAIAKLKASARALEQVGVPLSQAAGLVLAEDVVARIASPRQNNSAMDGYAIRAQDLPGPFMVVGESAAGTVESPPIGQSEAVRIFTGAPMPVQADRIIVQEICKHDGQELQIVGEIGDNPYTRLAGSDFADGDTLLPKGSMLGPGQLVVAAAGDASEVAVWRNAKVAILATGDELIAPGIAADNPGTIPESVSVGIAAMIAQWGGSVTAIRTVPDDPAAIEGEAAAMLDPADIVVVIGGASVGSRDFAKHAVAGGNFQTVFSRVAMQPGKPVWCASDGAGRYVLGLPGNPVSALVTARLFLMPLLCALAGRDFDTALCWQDAELLSDRATSRAREQFARGVRQGDGITLLDNQLSSSQRSLAEADALIRIPSGDGTYSVGTALKCLHF